MVYRGHIMIIKLNEIPVEGLFLQMNQTDRKMSAALKDILTGNPFEVETHIMPVDQGYELYGSITGTRQLECSFCLNQFKKSFSEKFHDLYLKGKGKGKAKAMDTLRISDISSSISIFPLKSFKLSLSGLLREILVLATDFQVLCQKDCRGLCHSCGNNLNYEVCSCQVEENKNKSPFSVLKKLQVVLKNPSQERI